MSGYYTNQTYPKQSLMQYPFVLELKKRGGKAKPTEVYEALADYFNLSVELRTITVYENTKELKWHNIVRWVRQQLVNKGLLKNEERGIWELTETAMSKFLDLEAEHALAEDTVQSQFSQFQLESLLEVQKEVGKIGEEIVLTYEKQELSKKGLDLLAQKVRIVSVENCRLGYDILSYFDDGSEKYIEVKSSTSTSEEFYISINELKTALDKKEKYIIFLVRGVDIDNRSYSEIIKMDNFSQGIESESVNLVPIKWRVLPNE